jgi:hypothetical protein
MVLRMLPPRRLPTILDFGSVSGLRLNECLLEWSQVNWDVRKIEKQGNHADKYADLIDEVAAIWTRCRSPEESPESRRARSANRLEIL